MSIVPWLVIIRPQVMELLAIRVLEDRHGYRERKWREWRRERANIATEGAESREMTKRAPRNVMREGIDEVATVRKAEVAEESRWSTE